MTKDQLRAKINELQKAISQGLTAVEQIKTQISIARGKMEAYGEMLQQTEETKDEADRESQVEK